MRRANNQDNFRIVLSTDSEQWKRTGDLLIVADGMGAHAAGELASEMSVKGIPLNYLKLHAKADPADALQRAFEETNREIFLRGTENPEFRNMGTTTSAVAFLPHGALIAHVGDSRIYRLRGNILEQLTFDHSLVWEMSQNGDVSEEALRDSGIPKNVITRSLGPGPSVLVALEGPFPIKKGDRYLLCSDGLTGPVRDEEIGIVLGLLDIETACKALVDLANVRGGPDNITVVIGELHRDSLASDATSIEKTTRPGSRFPLPFGVAATIGLLAAIFLILVQQMPLAILFAAASLVSLFTGWIKMAMNTPTTPRDSQLGKAPYRKYSCSPSLSFATDLKTAIEGLIDWFVENGRTNKLDGLRAKLKHADAQIESKDLKSATSSLLVLLVDVMREIRSQKNDEAEGQIEY